MITNHFKHIVSPSSAQSAQKFGIKTIGNETSAFTNPNERAGLSSLYADLHLLLDSEDRPLLGDEFTFIPQSGESGEATYHLFRGTQSEQGTFTPASLNDSFYRAGMVNEILTAAKVLNPDLPIETGIPSRKEKRPVFQQSFPVGQKRHMSGHYIDLDEIPNPGPAEVD